MPTKGGSPNSKNVPGSGAGAASGRGQVDKGEADLGERRHDDDEAVAFAEAIRGVRRLSGAERVTPGVVAALPGRRAAAAARDPIALGTGGAGAGAGAGDFRPPIVEQSAGTWAARADGVDRRVLRKLRAGNIAVEGTLDLHGLTRPRAKVALESFLAGARAAGRRCLVIIHGRGLHSGADGPALGDVVHVALTEGNQAGNVLACCAAPPHMGGGGATLVLLRR